MCPVYFRSFDCRECKTMFTDRISVTHDLNLDYDLDLQSPASYGHHLLTCKSSRSAVSRFQRWGGSKRTDKQMDGGDCITSLTNAAAVVKHGLAFTTVKRSKVNRAHGQEAHLKLQILY